MEVQDQNKTLREFLEAKEKERHFVFVPFAELPKINGLFIPMSSKVTMLVDDFYPTQKTFGIKHFALLKLADAAGINWSSDGKNVGRQDDMRNPNYCSYRVVGRIRSAEGLYSEFSASKHIDLDARRSASVTKHADQFDFKKNKGWKIYPADKDAYVQKYVERDIGQLKGNIDELCESGAQARVIKHILHIPGSTPALNTDEKVPAWVGREFHIVRYAPDPVNEYILKAQVGAFTTSLDQIYGGQPVSPIAIAAPAPTIAQSDPIDVTPLPEKNTPEPENVTKKTEPVTQSDEKLTDSAKSSIADFELLDHEGQVRTVLELIAQSGYQDAAQDVKQHGPFSKWTPASLVKYFIHLNIYVSGKEDEK